MSDDKKKGFFSRLFGANDSCGCNLKIVEVDEEQSTEAKEEQSEVSDKKSQKPKDSSCCCRQPNDKA